MMAGIATRVSGPHSLIDLRSIRIAIAIVLSHSNFGRVRLRHRQRHVLTRRDHIELPWKQHHEPAAIANAPSNARSVIPGAPVQIGACRSNYGGSRILGDHQAAEKRSRVCALN
jgi:hypothetical protein